VVSRQRFRVWTSIVALLVALLVSSVMALRAPDTVQGDERGFLYYGNMQAEMYWACVTGQGEACDDWRWGEAYQGYGVHNPKLGMYLLGLADQATRGLQTEQRVPAMRLFFGLLASLCVAGMAWLGAGGRARLGGVLAACLLLIHPVFRACQVSLLPDLPMLLLVIGALIGTQAAIESRSWRQGLWLLDAGLLVGLAISTKLYALALLPAVLGALLIRARDVGWRGWLGLMLGLALGAAVFVGSNPYLWADPAVALRAMTVDHVHALQLQGLAADMATLEPGLGLTSVGYLGWLPFTLVTPLLDPRSEIHGLAPLSWTWLGIVLGGMGLLLHMERRRWLPVLWALSCFGLTAWVVSRFDPSWLYPRTFLLPSMAAVWLGSCVLDGLGKPRKLG
jgi:hypothetical protein